MEVETEELCVMGYRLDGGEGREGVGRCGEGGGCVGACSEWENWVFCPCSKVGVGSDLAVMLLCFGGAGACVW